MLDLMETDLLPRRGRPPGRRSSTLPPLPIQEAFDFWMPLVGAIGAWGHLFQPSDAESFALKLSLGWGRHTALTTQVYEGEQVALVCKAFVNGAWSQSDPERA